MALLTLRTTDWMWTYLWSTVFSCLLKSSLFGITIDFPMTNTLFPCASMHRKSFIRTWAKSLRWLPVSTSNTTACWSAGNRLRYFPAAILSLCGKTRTRSVEALGSGAGHTFSADCQSSLSFPWWRPVITTLSTLKQHLCWLPVIPVVPMMTSSIDIEKTTVSMSMLLAFTIVPTMTSSHHNAVHVEATSVLTASHHYHFHDDFQSSQQTQSGESHVRSQSACMVSGN